MKKIAITRFGYAALPLVVEFAKKFTLTNCDINP